MLSQLTAHQAFTVPAYGFARGNVPGWSSWPPAMARHTAGKHFRAPVRRALARRLADTTWNQPGTGQPGAGIWSVWRMAALIKRVARAWARHAPREHAAMLDGAALSVQVLADQGHETYVAIRIIGSVPEGSSRPSSASYPAPSSTGGCPTTPCQSEP